MPSLMPIRVKVKVKRNQQKQQFQSLEALVSNLALKKKKEKSVHLVVPDNKERGWKVPSLMPIRVKVKVKTNQQQQQFQYLEALVSDLALKKKKEKSVLPCCP